MLLLVKGAAASDQKDSDFRAIFEPPNNVASSNKDPDFGAIFGPPKDAAADKKDPDCRAIFGPPYGAERPQEAVCLLVFVLVVVQVLAASVWIRDLTTEGIHPNPWPLISGYQEVPLCNGCGRWESGPFLLK